MSKQDMQKLKQKSNNIHKTCMEITKQKAKNNNTQNNTTKIDLIMC